MEDFERAIETSNSFKRKPNDSELLKLYSLYKQSTIGDCNTSRPGMFDFKGRAKWDAWKERHGMDKKEAMEIYAQFVTQLSSIYNN